jgi:hypothetical protein
MRKAIIVISAPRVGSSCLAGCLNLCGASLGKSKANVRDKFNPKGYFENYEIMAFNRKILKDFGADIFSLCPSIHFDKAVEKLLHCLIKREFSRETIFVMKDPRILLLWIFYEKVLKDLSIEVFFVEIRRDVKTYLKSTEKFLGLAMKNETYREALFRMYYELGDKISGAYSRVSVEFEHLVKTPVEVMDRVCNEAGLTLNVKAIENFVDPRLKHW